MSRLFALSAWRPLRVATRSHCSGVGIRRIDIHTSGEFAQAPAVLSGVAKGSASEQSLVSGELATVLVHRSRLNILTKAKCSRFEISIPVTFFREEWGCNVEAFPYPFLCRDIAIRKLLGRAELPRRNSHAKCGIMWTQVAGPRTYPFDAVPDYEYDPSSIASSRQASGPYLLRSVRFPLCSQGNRARGPLIVEV